VRIVGGGMSICFYMTNCEGHYNLAPHKTKYTTQYAHDEMGKKTKQNTHGIEYNKINVQHNFKR
jgi:hypothetical protein